MRTFSALGALAALATAPAVALAQQPAPAVALSVGVANCYRFQAGRSPLANSYNLGSNVRLVLHDTWYLGFAQLTSLAPATLLPTAPTPGRVQLAEYALGGGYQWRFAPAAYALGGVQAGFGTLRRRSGSLPPEWLTSPRGTFLTAAATVGVGYQLTSFLALEAEGGYHHYFRGRQLPVATHDLRNVSAGVSVVGTFGLRKAR